MNYLKTKLSQSLGLNGPLIVAPMAGGPTTPALVAAASSAGALGSIGAAYLKASEIEQFAVEVRAQTSAPFAINLFIPQGSVHVSQKQLAGAVSANEKFRRELGLPEPSLQTPYEENFNEQFEAVLKVKPAGLSVVFGLLKREHIQAARKNGIYVMGTATSLAEACEIAESGADAVILQGFEAGGHRGLFSVTTEDPKVLAFDLLKQTKSTVRLPLILAGGIMNASDIRRALDAGADAVQMGTAFLCCQEAGTSAPYRQALKGTRTTKTTRVFSGRFARGIMNRYMREMDSSSGILPWPAQNKLTRDLRNASVAAGSPDFLSLWSGTGQGELWTGSASELIQNIYSELSQQE